MIKTYSKLITLPTFEERFKYLRLHNQIGIETFGFDRFINQKFYRSAEWKQIRAYIIDRDSGCDLGIKGREIPSHIIIHHMNPLQLIDITNSSEFLLNPEYLICVSHNTHQAIHYGDASLLITTPVERSMNDTCPWKH